MCVLAKPWAPPGVRLLKISEIGVLLARLILKRPKSPFSVFLPLFSSYFSCSFV